MRCCRICNNVQIDPIQKTCAAAVQHADSTAPTRQRVDLDAADHRNLFSPKYVDHEEVGIDGMSYRCVNNTPPGKCTIRNTGGTNAGTGSGFLIWQRARTLCNTIK